MDLRGGEREPELSLDCEIGGTAPDGSEPPIRARCACRYRYHPAIGEPIAYRGNTMDDAALSPPPSSSLHRRWYRHQQPKDNDNHDAFCKVVGVEYICLWPSVRVLAVK